MSRIKDKLNGWLTPSLFGMVIISIVSASWIMTTHTYATVMEVHRSDMEQSKELLHNANVQVAHELDLIHKEITSLHELILRKIGG